MATLIAVINQKGGVGKTTTAFNLGARFRILGKKVLFVDMDSQCSLTMIMQGRYDGTTMYELLLNKGTDAETALQKLPEGDLLPGSPMLSTLDIALTQVGKEYRLKEVLSGLADKYDYIIMDGPPTLGVATINMLAAADKIIIPTLADVFGTQSIGQLYETIKMVKQYCNPGLEIEGIVLIRHKGNQRLDKAIRDDLENIAEKIHTKLFRSSIRESVAVREAEVNQKSIFSYAAKSPQAEDFCRLADEMLGIVRQDETGPEEDIQGQISIELR